jgi:hypothetical protein
MVETVYTHNSGTEVKFLPGISQIGKMMPDIQEVAKDTPVYILN